MPAPATFIEDPPEAAAPKTFVPDPDLGTLATGVSTGMEMTNRLLSTLGAGAEGSEMARAQGLARLTRGDVESPIAAATPEQFTGGLAAISKPILPLFPKFGTAGMRELGAGAREAIATALRPAMSREQADRLSRLSPSDEEYIQDVAGVQESLADMGNFFTSPLGIATLGIGTLPAALQRTVALGFATQMASQTPEIARELGTELGKPADQRDHQKIAKLTTDAITTTGFTVGGAIHGLAPRAPTPPAPFVGPIATGEVLPLRRGVRPEAAPRLQLATPEEAAARAAQMTREATAGFTPTVPRAPRPEVPETAPEPLRETGVLREIVDNVLITRRQVQDHFRRTGGRVPSNEEASALLKAAWKREEPTYAPRIGPEQEYLGVAQRPDVPTEPTEVRPGEGEPDRGRGGVVSGAPEEAPTPPKVEGEEPPPAEGAAGEPVPKPPTPPAGAPAETELQKAERESKEAKEAEGKMIGERIKSGKVKPENVVVTINPPMKVGEKTIPGFVQVDEVHPTEGNVWSNNAETLRKYGFDIPSTEELLKLKGGQYKLPQIREMMKELKPAEAAKPTGVAPAAAKVETEVQKVATTEGQRPAKDVKAELVSTLEKALADAPKRSDFNSITGKLLTEAAKKAKDKITISIPGDGDFTILNRKENIEELLSRAKRISTTAGTPRKALVIGGPPELKETAEAATRAYGSADNAYKSVKRQVEALQAQEPPRTAEEREAWNKQIQGGNALMSELFEKTKAGQLEIQAEGWRSRLKNYQEGVKGFDKEIARIEALKKPSPARKVDLVDLKARRAENQLRIEQMDIQARKAELEAKQEREALEAAEPTKPAAAPAEPAAPVEPAAAPEAGIAEKVVTKLESAADEARKRLKAKEGGITFGAGPFHELPNIRDYAIIGAAKLARFGMEKARWITEMIKEFGERIRPHLDILFDESKSLFERHAEIVKAQETPVQQIIAEATGTTRAPADTIHKIIETLQSSLKTVRALRDHFTGAPQVSRAEVKLADDFLEADANRIRESLTELAKQNLPVAERGRFLTAIANATRRSPLLTGDPEAMYRRAAEVAARIEDRSVEVKKGAAINEIRDNVNKALASPTVDIGFKARIADLVQRLTFTTPTAETVAKLKGIRDYIARQEAQGVDVDMPKEILNSLELLNKVPARDMPLHVLEAIRDKVALLEEMGRRMVKTRQLRWENEKAGKNRELAAEQTNPIDERQEFRAQPGETTSPTMKIRNFLNRRLDGAALLDKALLPIDALFDLLGDAKGEYRGWLFKHVRNRIDLGFNAAQVMRDRITKPLEDIIRANNLTEQNSERIGVYAALQQEGGRERLQAMGVDPKVLDRIERGLTAPEMAAYHEMRRAMDALLPEVQKLMHELYNIPVEPVENYFPMPRDWSQMEIEARAPKAPKFGEAIDFDELGGWKQMLGDFISPKTTKTERGFTISRLPGAETPIKINAFDVYLQHINDVAYLLSTQRDIKMIGELAKGDLFVEKYGKIGQSMVLNWLDTVARQGHLGGFRRWNMLDVLRKNTSAGVIGFRLASQFVHLSNIPLAMERTGVMNYQTGLRAAFTPEGERFLKENFAETYARGGGEPALAEAMKEGATVFGKQVVPKSWVRAGFQIARFIDQKNSQATVLGMYFKALKEKGIDPSTYADIPIDKEAQARALVMARRAVASPLPKDVPMALSRGALTGGNISIGRAMFQFQNIFLDQWSNIRHDLARAGIREVNPVKALRMAFALTAMIAAETSIREASKEVIKSITGFKPKKERPTEAKVAIEVLRRFPFMGQLTAGILYGETGVPLIDSALQVPREAYRAATAKGIKAADKAKIRAIAGTAQLLGVPGSSQVGELLEKSQ